MAGTDFEAAIAAAVGRVGPAVVALRRGWEGGCGTVVGDGEVLTNAHNLRHPEVSVKFADGRAATGEVTASDLDLDLAVVRVDTGGTQPLPWEPEDVGEVSIGRAVLGLSNPGGRGLHVAPGFVSSVTASFRGPRGRRVKSALEHTAPLPRGSSGGPLVDTEGRLLALNSVRLHPGLVVAITLDQNTARRVDALRRGDAPRGVRLGVAVAPPRAARHLRAAVGLPEQAGVLVRAVQEDSPADRAGIRRGDLIIAASGRPMPGLDALHDSLDAATATGQLELKLLRGAEELNVLADLDGS